MLKPERRLQRPVMHMIPSRLELAASGLDSALDEMASSEERAHAFLDTLATLPSPQRTGLPAAFDALDRIDVALHDLRQAVRRLDVGGESSGRTAMVRLRSRSAPDPVGPSTPRVLPHRRA